MFDFFLIWMENVLFYENAERLTKWKGIIKQIITIHTFGQRVTKIFPYFDFLENGGGNITLPIEWDLVTGGRWTIEPVINGKFFFPQSNRGKSSNASSQFMMFEFESTIWIHYYEEPEQDEPKITERTSIWSI